MAKTIRDLPIGAKMKDLLTKYYGSPIVWLLGDKNHTGYPDNSASLITDRIIRTIARDALEPRNSNEQRQKRGNERYDQSNIRQWLIKDSLPWFVAANANDTPPNSKYVTSDAYESERGFLSNFSPQLRALLMPTTYPVSLSYVDSFAMLNLTDPIFLLSVMESGLGAKLSDYGQGNISEGSKWPVFNDASKILGRYTKEAAEHAPTASNEDTIVRWHLRSPYANGWDDGGAVNVVGVNGTKDVGFAYQALGLRPAINIPLDTLVNDEPDANGVYTILWNNPPTTPTGISIPERIQISKPVEITWGAGADADGDPLTYELERSVDASAYTKIHTGAALRHTDTAGANWTTVQYRVRATDGKDAYSDYAISPIRPVIHNVDPIVTGTDTDLGTVTAPPSYAYQVNDTDSGDVLTVTEQLDSATLRTIPNAERNKQYTCTLSTGQYVSLMVGQHRMSIVVADDKGNSAARNITFSREVNNIRFEAHAAPADAMPEKVLISLRCSADPDAVSIKVCNNYLDASPTWEPAADRQKHLFSNTTKTTNHWMVGVQVSITKSPGLEEIVCFALSGAYL